MVNCTCYDYQQGHLCKHTHKVYSHEKQEQNGTDEDDSLEISDADTPDEENQVTILKTHVAPSKAIQDKAGIVMNRSSVRNWRWGVLDHVLSKIFAIATSVQAYCKPQTENPAPELVCFHVTDKFAPAQKNETQLRFQNEIHQKEDDNFFTQVWFAN